MQASYCTVSFKINSKGMVINVGRRLESGGVSIPHMRVRFRPIRLAGSLGYLTGSWRKALTHSISILIHIGEQKKHYCENSVFFSQSK